MGNQELLWRLEIIRRLEEQRTELEAQIETLKDEVKAEMRAQGVEKMTVGTHRVSWTRFTTHRFDTKALKADHEDIYLQYNRPMEARRFVIS